MPLLRRPAVLVLTPDTRAGQEPAPGPADWHHRVAHHLHDSVRGRRITRPDAHGPFKVPAGAIIPVLGVLSCLYLMVSLSVMTWVRLLVWLDIGMLIYWFYGRTHSSLADPREAAARTGGEAFGNTLTIAGYLLLFNGAAITLLALLTEWNVTTETLARWSELDALVSRVGIRVTPEIADRFGLTIVGVGLGVAAVGWLIGRLAGASTGRPGSPAAR